MKSGGVVNSLTGNHSIAHSNLHRLTSKTVWMVSCGAFWCILSAANLKHLPIGPKKVCGSCDHTFHLTLFTVTGQKLTVYSVSLKSITLMLPRQPSYIFQKYVLSTRESKCIQRRISWCWCGNGVLGPNAPVTAASLCAAGPGASDPEGAADPQSGAAAEGGGAEEGGVCTLAVLLLRARRLPVGNAAAQPCLTRDPPRIWLDVRPFEGRPSLQTSTSAHPMSLCVPPPLLWWDVTRHVGG